MSVLNHDSRWLAVLLALVFSHPLVPARAQSLNYSATEQLFGEPVTASATGSPQRSSDVPVSMEIITADEIRRSGAYDIPGVLRHVMGINYQQWTDDQAEISVRGYDQPFAQRTMVLIDGRQVYDDNFSYVPWNALPVPLEGIRQIEVVLGPANALYGYNAVAGVINIVTWNPLYDDHNVVTARTGTQGLADGSGVVTYHTQDVGVRLMGSAESDSDFSTPVPPSMLDGADRRDERSSSIDLDAVARLWDTIEAQVEASRSESRRNEFTPSYNLSNARTAVSSLMGQVSADLPVGVLQLRTYNNWLNQYANSLFFGLPADFTNRLNVIQLQDLFKPAARHSFRLGTEFRHSSADTAPVGGGDVYYQTVSGSGMWEWRISRMVTLTNAFRYDALQFGRAGASAENLPSLGGKGDRTFDKLNYNSGIVIKPDASDTVRLTAADGVLLPNLFTLGALVAIQPALGPTASISLRPTTVKNWEVSWDHALAPLAAMLRVRLYDQQTNQIQALQGNLNSFRPDNVAVVYDLSQGGGSSNAVGLEMGLRGTFEESWRWGLSAELEKIRDRLSRLLGDGAAFLDYDDTTPHAIVNANIGWAQGRWEADLYAHYESHEAGLQSSADGTSSVLVPVPGYVDLEGRVDYKVIAGIDLALSGQNLLRSRQRQTSGPAAERRVLGTFTWRF